MYILMLCVYVSVAVVVLLYVHVIPVLEFPVYVWCLLCLR